MWVEFRHRKDGKRCCVDENDKSDEQFKRLGIDELGERTDSPGRNFHRGARLHWGRLGEVEKDFLLSPKLLATKVE